jgi:hypothetical protein
MFSFFGGLGLGIGASFNQPATYFKSQRSDVGNFYQRRGDDGFDGLTESASFKATFGAIAFMPLRVDLVCGNKKPW